MVHVMNQYSTVMVIVMVQGAGLLIVIRVFTGLAFFSTQRSSEDHQGWRQAVSLWASVVSEVIKLRPSLERRMLTKNGVQSGVLKREEYQVQ